MSDYRRFISYIYLYENGIKSMNAGFVKVESRNGQCRIGLSLKNVYTGMGRFKVYMFIRFGQELRGIYIGDVQIKNHGSEWNFRTFSDNIAGSGYRLEQMSGMIIKGEGDRFYGTRWDQGDLDMGRFVTEWDDTEPPEEVTGELTAEQEPESEPEPKTELEPTTGKAETRSTIKEEETTTATTPEESETEALEETSLTTEEIENKEAPVTLEMDERSRNFGKIIEQCPGMYPFDDDAFDACVRLEPQDIGMMPIDCWSYGNNSFLLHGYYSYRHLILARMKQDVSGHQTYILGVPGTHHSREAFMANMFGFRDFKPIREGGDSSSDFGYWYTFLG
ncbi:DUF6128 domain-containing protein [Frisingicoccus sp.]|uniref:DUF6128 domain-containing protein n=1 Tax=Frisingicoccus sp. TaxID=1918627 RepID=UPI00386AB38F